MRVLWMEQENPIMQHVWRLVPEGRKERCSFLHYLPYWVPIVTGLVLGVPGVIGLLAGSLTVGFLLAVFMANAGEPGTMLKSTSKAGAFGGKGSPAHKAAVVGDTVGDPFKDTSRPSLNILIKLMAIVSVVFANYH